MCVCLHHEQVPALVYEDVFNMVAVCQTADSKLVECPLVHQPGMANLVYYPVPGVPCAV